MGTVHFPKEAKSFIQVMVHRITSYNHKDHSAKKDLNNLKVLEIEPLRIRKGEIRFSLQPFWLERSYKCDI